MSANPYSLTILQVPKDIRSSLYLTKRYTPGPNGKLVREEYGAGKLFDVSSKVVNTIQEWAAFHLRMMTAPHACLIRGEPVQGLNPEKAQRLISNFPDAPRHWIVIDFDKPDLSRGEDGALDARRLLPPAFHAAPFWWARTSSYGIDYEGRKSKGDPWRSRIRLGFMADTPLTGPQLKYWLRNHQCDLALYTSNQICYTANPIFADGAIDPVLAAGEARFGTVDFDDAMFDTVPVPDEIKNYVPQHQGVAVKDRPATIPDDKRETLLEEARLCDTTEGEGLHGSVARWVFDAYGLGMDLKEIETTATETLVRLGRATKLAGPEAARLIVGAQNALGDGRLTISAHLNPKADFTPVDPDDKSLQAPTLTPSQANTQAAALTPWWDNIKRSLTLINKSTLDNAAIILANHSSFKDSTGACILAFDAFQDQAVWTDLPPWWRSRPEAARPKIGKLGLPVSDGDDVALAIWLGHLDPASGPEGQPIHIASNTAAQAISHVARYRTVNPAKAYMDEVGAKWDGKERLPTVLRDVCHARGNQELYAQWFPKWMIQAVARVYNPGTKCDAVLVFQGGQGAKKSTFFRTLCPFEEWFMEGIPELHDSDAMLLIRGKLIAELPEMTSTKRDVDKVKAFITKQHDTFRHKYGREGSTHRRTMIFCGTTNDQEFLSDTGGRRWWIVSSPTESEVLAGEKFDIARTIAERDQWWGEAVARYKRGEEWWLDKQSEMASSAVALHHSTGMEMSVEIARWLNLPSDHGGPANPDITTAIDIWSGPLCKARGQFNSGSGREIARLMVGVSGWKCEKLVVRVGTSTISAMTYFRTGSKMDIDKSSRIDYIKHHKTPNSNTDSGVAQPAA